VMIFDEGGTLIIETPLARTRRPIRRQRPTPRPPQTALTVSPMS
jgi:hypothetical protein